MAEEAIPTPRYRVVKQNGLGNLAKLSIYGFVIKRFFCKRIYIKGELLMKLSDSLVPTRNILWLTGSLPYVAS